MPINWRKYQERYNLVKSICSCGESFFPSRKTCICGKELANYNMPRTGKVISFTKVFVAPEGFEKETPYFLALIELENGVRVLSQIVDSDEVKIGDKVKKAFRIISSSSTGVINYGYKFVVE